MIDDTRSDEAPLLHESAIVVLDEVAMDVVQGVGASVVRHNRGTTEAQRLSRQAISPVIRLESRGGRIAVLWAEPRLPGAIEAQFADHSLYRIRVVFTGPSGMDYGRADFYAVECDPIVSAIQGHLL